jgi:hypothetical protein
LHEKSKQRNQQTNRIVHTHNLKFNTITQQKSNRNRKIERLNMEKHFETLRNHTNAILATNPEQGLQNIQM